VAVKTEALSIFALLLSAPGGFLPLDKDLSWMSQHQPQPFKTTVAQRSRCGEEPQIIPAIPA
jgi:hypothetical protein